MKNVSDFQIRSLLTEKTGCDTIETMKQRIRKAIKKIESRFVERTRYLPRYKKDKTVFEAEERDGEDLVLMSFNIRCFTKKDTFENHWYFRAPLVIRAIAEVKPDVIGFQEVRKPQEIYLKEHLKGYTFLDAYQSYGKRAESMTIAYAADRFTAEETGMFWQSETPERLSKSWGSGSYRDAAYAVLKDKKTGGTFTAINTHLDNVSDFARVNGIKVIFEQIKKRALPRPVLFGDMNAYPDEGPYHEALFGGLVDAMAVAEKSDPGPGPTWHDYGRATEDDRIDYFFVSPDVSVREYAAVCSSFDGVYPSDHYPITIKIDLRS